MSIIPASRLSASDVLRLGNNVIPAARRPSPHERRPYQRDRAAADATRLPAGTSTAAWTARHR